MRLFTMRFAAAVLLIWSTVAAGAVLYLDDFEDGDYTAAAGDTGLSWQVLKGGASVSSGQLAINRDTCLLVTNETVADSSFTVSFLAVATWSERGQFVFLYKDTANYYWQGLGHNAGIYRVMDGTEEKIYTDAGSQLRLPHQSSASNTFKIHVDNTGSALEFRFDRGGDGLDFDVYVTDTSSVAAAAFAGATAIGAGCQGSGTSGSWFKVDDVTVHSGLKADARTPLTLYVDAANGDDTRTIAQAQNEATPWKSVQTAADSAMAGDVVRVKPGIYREEVIPANAANRETPITFMAHDNSDKPVMDGSVFINQRAWTETTITDFEGTQHTVYKTSIDWEPRACYQNEVQMFLSQEPDQSDAADPYNLDEFMVLPEANNTGLMQNVLYDPAFFTQTDPSYWIGANLMVYDGFNNGVSERQITNYIPAQNAVITDPFGIYIGPNEGRQDKYAVQKHISVLDKPGEFYVDVLDTPHTIYVMPFTGVDVSTITASKYDNAFNLSGGYKKGIVIDGFDIRFYTEHGIEARNHSDDLIVRSCEIHHNMSSGITGNGVEGLVVENCYLHANYSNGANFSNGADYTVRNTEITANADNGIWCGNGSSNYFTTDGFTVKGCYIHRQGGRRRHPDNYQIHQVKNARVEDNVFIQEGQQNFWCQYTDEFYLINNIFMGGTLGLNSSIHNYVWHNVFYKSGLRYDAHLDNHPNHGDYYKPQHVEIKNNLIIESSISWPAADVVDKFDVYAVGHNYYNIEGSYSRASWTFDGYRMGVYQGGSVMAASPVSSGNSAEMAFRASITWSAHGRFICYYKDADNYYSFGLGGDAGIFRMLNGTEEKVMDDPGTVRIPHSSGTWADYRVSVANTGSAIDIKIARDDAPGTWDAEFSDTDAGAVAAFSTVSIGAMTSDTAANSPRTFIDSVVFIDGTDTLFDGFEDGDFTAADGASGMTWTAVAGSAAVSAGGGRGTGVGDGSIMHTSLDSLAAVIMTPPDSLYETYDYRPADSFTVLRDAGTPVNADKDKDGQDRWMGNAPDIGPYEYFTTGIALSGAGAKAELPALLVMPNPVHGSFAVTVNGPAAELVIARVTGTPLGSVPVTGGKAFVDTGRLGMKAGMYLIGIQDGQRMRKLILME